ncbi:DUF3742 family protein [Pseudomonas sp. LRF_L74]|uniref:DUF3742 family protein n=1 Tax=Pseudomonas sp. LRF_L74 TaxID=3369422 RepID=UPI003F6352BD
MATEKTTHDSSASRFGYRFGSALRNGYRRISAFESRCAQRAGERDWPIGPRGIRVLFVTAKIALVGLTLFIGLWLAVSVLTLVVLAFAIAHDGSDAAGHSPIPHDEGPDYLGASTYLGNYDDNGHWIGHFKSSDDPK